MFIAFPNGHIGPKGSKSAVTEARRDQLSCPLLTQHTLLIATWTEFTCPVDVSESNKNCWTQFLKILDIETCEGWGLDDV